MSERDDELEIQALQRELDDAFATTRPRRGFEDELWTRMQAARPAGNRLRDAFAGFFQALREVPAVPAAGLAAILVVALGAGLLAYSGLGRGGGGASAVSQSSYGGQQANSDLSAGGFGRLPAPGLPGAGGKNEAGGPLAPEVRAAFQYTWSGNLQLTATTAPVYRYHEPTAAAADQFANSLGAVLRERPDGLLGSYAASTYTLNVAGTRTSPPASPTYYMIATPSMPAIDSASSNPADVATVYLAGHGLVPDWQPLVSVDSSGSLVMVRLARQFQVSGYGAATLVDPAGRAYGVEVDLQGNRPILVTGMLPMTMDAADYRLIAPGVAVQALPAAGANSSSVPTVQLTKAELVYVLAPAGDHSYFEPAYMFSGTAKVNGVDTPQRVLVPAVDPSQRAS